MKRELGQWHQADEEYLRRLLGERKVESERGLGYHYLASPYSHKDERVRSDRAELAAYFAAQFVRKGMVVYCPVAHGHMLAPHVPEAEDRHDLWMAQCFVMLMQAASMIVLPLPGWRQSKGVRLELDFALANDIPVRFHQSQDDQFGRYLERLGEEERKVYSWGIV